jgi:precorrin-2 dehydrogenase/sirohydrochlorin ferrochelatase
MLPIVLNPAALRVGVIGAGEGLERRLQMLAEAGVKPVSVFKDLSGVDAVEPLHVLFVAGLDEVSSQTIADLARDRGVLVNVEDRPALCDFHVPAAVRRGDLLFTVSTGGRSPALARVLREQLDRQFGADWQGRLNELARLRAIWRDEGASPAEISERTRTLLTQKGWLS